MTKHKADEKAAKAQAEANEGITAGESGTEPARHGDTTSYPGIEEGLAPGDPKLTAPLNAEGEVVKPGDKPKVNFDESDRGRLAALEQRIAVLEGRQAEVGAAGTGQAQRTPIDMTRAGAQTEGRAPQSATLAEGEGDDYHVSVTGNPTPLAQTEMDVKAKDEQDALNKFYRANGISGTAVQPVVTKGKKE